MSWVWRSSSVQSSAWMSAAKKSSTMFSTRRVLTSLRVMRLSTGALLSLLQVVGGGGGLGAAGVRGDGGEEEAAGGIGEHGEDGRILPEKREHEGVADGKREDRDERNERVLHAVHVVEGGQRGSTAYFIGKKMLISYIAYTWWLTYVQKLRHAVRRGRGTGGPGDVLG